MKNTEGLGKLLKKQLNDIVNNNLSNLFTDNVFPPTDDSIYDDIHKTPFQKSKKNKLYQWVRLSEFEEFSNFNILKLPETYFKDEDVISEDVIQGHLGDCYLLSALSAFAEFPKRIQNILSESEINKSGIYKVKCYLHGIPEIVVLDDYFPCIKDELKKNNEGKYIDVKAIAFAGINKKTYNIWPLLLEKAWAKVNSNFENIISGNCAEVFEFFSPSPFKSYLHEFALNENLFSNLKFYDKSNYVICTDITNYTGGDPTYHTKLMETLKESGLVTNHAYSLIDVAEIKDKFGNDVQLLKIRNPWGNYEWNGDWSDKSDKWTPELKELLNFEEEEDGTFFISYQDFIRFYTTTHVAMIHDDYFFTYCKMKILKTDDLNFEKFNEKLIKVDISEDSKGFFLVNLKNSRIYKNFKNIDEFTNIYVSITIVRIDGETITTIGSSAGRKNRHFVSCENLKKGEYYFYIRFPFCKKNKLISDENSDEDLEYFNSLNDMSYIIGMYMSLNLQQNNFTDISEQIELKRKVKKEILLNLVKESKEKYYFSEEGEDKALRAVSFEKNKGGSGYIYLENPSEAVLIEKFDFVELYGCYLKPIFIQNCFNSTVYQYQDKSERELVKNLKQLISEKDSISYGIINKGIIKNANQSALNDKKVSFENNLTFDLMIPPFSKSLIELVKYEEDTGVQFKSQVVFIYPIYVLLNETKFFSKCDTVMLKYNNEEVEIFETLIVTESGIVFKYKNKTNAESKKLVLYLKMRFSSLVNLKLNKLMNTDDSGYDDVIESLKGIEKVHEENSLCVTVHPGEVKAFELRAIDAFLEFDYNCEAEVAITLY